MGSPISSTISEIYIQFLEELYVKQWLDSRQILYYKRYVDDILIIYDQNKTNEQDILNHANNIDKHLQFKLSTELNNLINYLDLSIEIIATLNLESIENPQVLTPPYAFHLTIHMNIS
jgi:hypothetical protein